MTEAVCGALGCIHHDGEGCMLDEVELAVGRDFDFSEWVLEGTVPERAVCTDYVEGS